jgi:lauroyl/myristoyl acyltransferase
MAMLRRAAFATIRAVGNTLPLPMMLALLTPFAFVRALLDTVRSPMRNPPRSLPPDRLLGRFSFAAARQRTRSWLNTASMLWADRFASGRWDGRIDVEALARLRPILETRPVIAVTVHYGGIFVLPTLLRAHGIPTASVVANALWPIRWWRRRRAELTSIDDLPLHFLSGDARAIVRYMKPGRAIVVAADYPFGEQLATTFDSARLVLSTSSLRLARVTNAAVVPFLVSSDSAWRFRLHVGEPVPDELIAGERQQDCVDHIAGELLPLAARSPRQALPLLVRAFQQGPAA